MRYSPRQRSAIRKIEKLYISEQTRKAQLDQAFVLLELVRKQDFNALQRAGIPTPHYD